MAGAPLEGGLGRGPVCGPEIDEAFAAKVQADPAEAVRPVDRLDVEAVERADQNFPSVDRLHHAAIFRPGGTLANHIG
jgi:hypothetical protein